MKYMLLNLKKENGEEALLRIAISGEGSVYEVILRDEKVLSKGAAETIPPEFLILAGNAAAQNFKQVFKSPASEEILEIVSTITDELTKAMDGRCDLRSLSPDTLGMNKLEEQD